MKKVVGLLAGLCLCAGCEDKLPEPTRPAVSAERFVVDYTAGVATRAIHENQTKGVRINSLTYLLYNSEGTLEKRREIPGLDGDGESWPLTRANMSWEQREALKDTLLQEETYHAVFVANIDSAICGWTDENGEAWSPLRETEKYETVHLQMPYQPLNDRNMFYLFTQEIVSTDQGADREKPYNCPVMLRRAVTRTDFWFEQLPVWEENPGGDEGTHSLYANETTGDETTGGETPDDGGEPGVDKPIEGESGSGEGEPGSGDGSGNEGGDGEGEGGEPSEPIDPNYPIYPVDCKLPKDIKNYFWSDFYSIVMYRYNDQLSKPVVDALTGIDGLLTKLGTYYGTIGNNLLYANKIVIMSEDIKGIGKAEFLNRINEDLVSNEDFLSKFQTHLLHTLLNELVDNHKIRGFFADSEKRTSNSYATISYEGKSGVNTLHLSGKNPTASLTESLCLKVDTAIMWNGVPYLGFNWLGLADPANNRVSTVSWYSSETKKNPTLTLSVGTPSLSTNQDMNEKRSVLYRPMDEFNLILWNKTKQTQIICDLKRVLPFDKLKDEGLFKTEDFIKDIEKLLKNKTLFPGYQYPLDQMVLTIDYPDITNDEVLEIKSIWEITN